jgi:hypothetical protein
VVLHAGDQNLVALPNVGITPGAGDQIDAFRRVSGEDDFAHRRRVHERAHFLPRAFIRCRRALAQFVDPAMDVRVVMFVVRTQRVDHRLRFLRGGGIVQIHQRLAVHLLVQGRKRRPNGSDVERRDYRAHL